MPQMAVNVPCPICSHKSLKTTFSVEEIPYFGECLQTVIICEKCSYKTVDFMITEQHEPMRFELKINEIEDMMIRVVRSSSSTIRIPEIRAIVEPGPGSDGYISNVEGVIDRITNIISQAIKISDDEKKAHGLSLLEKIKKIKNGDETATLIIEDPFGNSAIISDKAKKRILSENEVKRLMENI